MQSDFSLLLSALVQKQQTWNTAFNNALTASETSLIAAMIADW